MADGWQSQEAKRIETVLSAEEVPVIIVVNSCWLFLRQISEIFDFFGDGPDGPAG